VTSKKSTKTRKAKL